jgi:hypothetical protein
MHIIRQHGRSYFDLCSWSSNVLPIHTKVYKKDKLSRVIECQGSMHVISVMMFLVMLVLLSVGRQPLSDII